MLSKYRCRYEDPSVTFDDGEPRVWCEWLQSAFIRNKRESICIHSCCSTVFLCFLCSKRWFASGLPSPFSKLQPLKELQYFPPCNHNTLIILCRSLSLSLLLFLHLCFCRSSTTRSSDHNYPAKYINFSIQSKYPSQSLPLFHKHSRPIHFSSHFLTYSPTVAPFITQSASEQTSAWMTRMAFPWDKEQEYSWLSSKLSFKDERRWKTKHFGSVTQHRRQTIINEGEQGCLSWALLFFLHDHRSDVLFVLLAVWPYLCPFTENRCPPMNQSELSVLSTPQGPSFKNIGPLFSFCLTPLPLQSQFFCNFTNGSFSLMWGGGEGRGRM